MRSFLHPWVLDPHHLLPAHQIRGGYLSRLAAELLLQREIQQLKRRHHQQSSHLDQPAPLQQGAVPAHQ